MLRAQDPERSKATVAGRATQALRERILVGSLAPGTKLNLDQARDQLGVSVSSLREAVTRLVADGLLLAEEQKGYTVAPVSLENLAEVTRLRQELEPLALRAAIHNGGLDWETDVTAALYRLNHTARRPEDEASMAAWESAHNAFHAALIERCDMPILQRFLATLTAMNDRYRCLFNARMHPQRDVSAEHTAIAEAATRRDPERATALLAAHIEDTGAALKKTLSDTLPDTAA